jgi:hypothetical protein
VNFLASRHDPMRKHTTMDVILNHEVGMSRSDEEKLRFLEDTKNRHLKDGVAES